MAAWRPKQIDSQATQAAAKAAGSAGPDIAAKAASAANAASAVQGPAAAAESAIPALGKLAAFAGPAGIALGAVATAAGLAVTGVKLFASTIKEQVQELKMYSGVVAGASAESEIRQLMSTFRRAQRIGPDVAKWESMRGRFDEKLADLGTEILGTLLKFANEYSDEAEAALELLGLIVKSLEKNGPIIGAFLKGLTGGGLQAVQILQRILGNQEERKEKINGEFWDDFAMILPNRQAWTSPANNAPRRLPQDPFAGDPGIRAAQAANAAGGGP